MRFRSLDQSGDWVFGFGRQCYALNQAAVALSAQTRLNSFLNDCFYAPDEGIDWFNLLGSKNQAALVFSIRSVLIGTPGVNSIKTLSLDVVDRHLSATYSIQTVFGTSVTAAIAFPISPFSGISRFVRDIAFDGSMTTIDVDTSVQIADAEHAIWMLYDQSNGNSQVVGAVQIVNAGTVRITISPAPPAGLFTLVGIA